MGARAIACVCVRSWVVRAPPHADSRALARILRTPTPQAHLIPGMAGVPPAVFRVPRNTRLQRVFVNERQPRSAPADSHRIRNSRA